MLTVGDRLEDFQFTGVRPGETEPSKAFAVINDTDFSDGQFEGKWKILVFYPKDFTFVCPTEIVAYDALNAEFAKRNAVLFIGSTDNEFCKLAWKKSHPDLAQITSWMFADTQRDGGPTEDHQWLEGLSTRLGVFFEPAGAALRATFIVDPDGIIQHVTVNNLSVGRNPNETLRVLDAIQTGELCACNREIGGAVL
jgi:alkyl hydroperoxide reductase subunit AhpC